ncbi:MAG: hypothetical protein JO357_11735 [Hyphomicrobiales bacterium]|nr:hypothetical protein [Hyphomicrobiales bacterium]MBV8768925.1 hypothetical protein [Hyphomicrobiales bacterium]MBV9052868.1 hypothetical protein [Hyphomicrobiales bacterium]MBV9137718.1 hypothetical protein [Hyphomicrobiales bacterium]MBV9588003.1 hypothetical protein [Hyphomicrobiales bacterium]
MPGKRVQIDEETWQALVLLARDRKLDFQKLAEEAFKELLKKYDRPTTLKAALRRSAEQDQSRQTKKRNR